MASELPVQTGQDSTSGNASPVKVTGNALHVVPKAGLDGVAKGYEQVTGLSAAKGLTVPTGTTWALIQAEGQNVRWRDDGTNPTASVGMRLLVGEELTYTGSSLASLKFIEEAASAKLNVTYFG